MKTACTLSLSTTKPSEYWRRKGGKREEERGRKVERSEEKRWRGRKRSVKEGGRGKSMHTDMDLF